jgi:hypothetical protein
MVAAIISDTTPAISKPAVKMKNFLYTIPALALLKGSLSSPVAAPPLSPRATTSAAVATLTPGATAPSTAAVQAAIAGCSNTNLAGVTDNDVVNGVCKEFTLIFARGVSATSPDHM